MSDHDYCLKIGCCHCNYVSFTTDLNCVFILKLTCCYYVSSLPRLRFVCIYSRPAQHTVPRRDAKAAIGAVKELKAMETYKVKQSLRIKLGLFSNHADLKNNRKVKENPSEFLDAGTAVITLF